MLLVKVHWGTHEHFVRKECKSGHASALMMLMLAALACHLLAHSLEVICPCSQQSDPSSGEENLTCH